MFAFLGRRLSSSWSEGEPKTKATRGGLCTDQAKAAVCVLVHLAVWLCTTKAPCPGLSSLEAGSWSRAILTTSTMSTFVQMRAAPMTVVSNVRLANASRIGALMPSTSFPTLPAMKRFPGTVPSSSVTTLSADVDYRDDAFWKTVFSSSNRPFLSPACPCFPTLARAFVMAVPQNLASAKMFGGQCKVPLLEPTAFEISFASARFSGLENGSPGLRHPGMCLM